MGKNVYHRRSNGSFCPKRYRHATRGVYREERLPSLGTFVFAFVMFIGQATSAELVSSTSCPWQCLCSSVTTTPSVTTRHVLNIDCSNGGLQSFLLLTWSDSNLIDDDDNNTAGIYISSNNSHDKESSNIFGNIENVSHNNATQPVYDRGMMKTESRDGDFQDINLNLSFNNVSSLQALGMLDWKSAPVVKRLNLSNNHIENVNSSYFQEFYNLVILDLSNNVISEFIPSVFQHLPSLKYLYLQNNQISSILPQTTPGDFLLVSNLSYLDLSNNHLTCLSANVFITFPNVISLNLSQNKITNIDELAFTGLNQLQFLTLSNNNMTSLSYPVFQNTSLVSLCLDSMPHFSHLSHNVFKGLYHLQHLNLSRNSQLHFLHYDTFSYLQLLETVDLSGIAIQLLSSLTFRNNPRLQNVFLQNITLACQCTNAWLVEAMHNSFFHNASHLECFDIQNNQTVPIAEATFHCNNVSIANVQSTLSVAIGSTLSLQCNRVAVTSDEDILIWTTPRGHIYYYHHFHPNASQHLLRPTDVQLQAPFHTDHFWHQSTSYYSELSANKKRIQVLTDGSLFIDYVLRTDAGSYNCVVKNAHFNDSTTIVVHFSYNISGEIKLIACMVGILCALGFFTLNVIYVVISWLSRRLINKRRREHIRQMLENLNSYKSAQITRIYDNYSGQLTRVRNRYHVQRDRLHRNYTMQVERVKRGCSHQVEKVRDNYNNRLNQLREYSSSQINQIREMATNQIGRIRDYGSLQLDRLRETYKLQHQHMMKLLDTMNLDNCRSIVETECMRTESMMYDLDLLSQEDVRMESPFSMADADSEYNTATSSPLLSVGSQEPVNPSACQFKDNESGDNYELARQTDNYSNGTEGVTEPEEILKITRSKSIAMRSSNEMGYETNDDIQIEMNTVLNLPDDVQLDAKEVWTYGKGDESTHTLYTKLSTQREIQPSCVQKGEQQDLQINDPPPKKERVKSDKHKTMESVSLPSVHLDMLQQTDRDMGVAEQEVSPIKVWQGPPPLFHDNDYKDCATVRLYDTADEDEEEEKTETDTMV